MLAAGSMTTIAWISHLFTNSVVATVPATLRSGDGTPG